MMLCSTGSSGSGLPILFIFLARVFKCTPLLTSGPVWGHKDTLGGAHTAQANQPGITGSGGGRRLPALPACLALAPCPSGHRRRWAPQTPLTERGRKCQALVRFPSSGLAAEGTLATEGGRHPTGDTRWGPVPPQNQGAALG